MSAKLFRAIDANDPAAVREALRRVKNVNREGPEGYTPLQHACNGGRVGVIDVLLDAGANPAPGHHGSDAIVCAADEGHLDVIRKLAERTTPRAEAVESALESALRRGEAEVARFLLERYHPPVGGLAVVDAARRGDASLLRLLVEHGADLNVASTESGGNGYTPMHFAASNENPRAVRALAECGADVNARDEFGRTPLIVAVSSLHVMEARDALVAALNRAIEGGAIKTAGGDDAPGAGDAARGPGVTILGATEPAEGENTVAELLARGADASLTDYDGNDVLTHYEFEAARSRAEPDPRVVAALRKAGAPGSGPTGRLFAAVRAKDVDAVRAAAAAAAGADVNRIGPFPVRATPLTAGAYVGTPPLIRALLDAGADPNKPAGSTTPLIEAALAGNLEVVKTLLAAGADLNASEPARPGGVPGRNALLAAEMNRQFEMFDYLKSVGAARPTATTWKPAEPGIAYLDNFHELHVRADVATVAAALAQLTGGRVTPDAYGRSFPTGAPAFIVLRAKGLSCSQVLPLAPGGARDTNALEALGARLAAACGAPAFTAAYNDTAGAAVFARLLPDGTREREDGWDYDLLKDMVSAMEDAGAPVPDAMRRRLESFDPDNPGPDSVQRLRNLAEAEGLAFGLCWLNVEQGRPVDVHFPDRPAAAFDAVTHVGPA